MSNTFYMRAYNAVSKPVTELYTTEVLLAEYDVSDVTHNTASSQE